jgi:hypothetical protein
MERRRSGRERADAAVELIWRDESGNRRFECGRIVDRSAGGVGVASPQPLNMSSCLILRAPGLGVVALAQVRNCVWARTQYRLGMEVLERAASQPRADSPEPDHHELIRAGIAGEFERVDRLYRALAFRYHPDNRETGDAEVFMRIGQAYRILSGSQPQPVEAGIAKRLDSFHAPQGVRKQRDKRSAILGVLYERRASDYQNACVSTRELEDMTGMAQDEIGFILWYLREKGAVTLSDYSSDYAISAAGVDLLESVHLAESAR